MSTKQGHPHWPPEIQSIAEYSLENNRQTLEVIFNDLLSREDIPPNKKLTTNLETICLPLAAWIAALHTSETTIIGINGAQGSGKTTLVKLLTSILATIFHKSVTALSLDDFYKTRAERITLSETVHPLLKTRGVPGTHDIGMLVSLIRQLSNKQHFIPAPIPVFSKASDDRLPDTQWHIAKKPADIILLEGWCIGAIAETDYNSSLPKNINKLEATEDVNGSWRQSINQELAGNYAELFGMLHKLVMLKIPQFEKVLEWRTLQENKLRNRLKKSPQDNNKSDAKPMDPEDTRRFIMHYERLTRHMLAEMPARADIVLDIDVNHQIDGIQISQKPG